METNRHYFLVGMFVLITVIAALGFTIWLTSQGKGDFTRYRIHFAESVSGLSVGGVVKFRGVDVGSVESIDIEPADTRLIRVIIKVEKTTPIKTDTLASLKLQGITGVVYVELEGGSAEAALLPNDNRNDVIFEIKAKSSPISAIVDRLPEVLDRVSKAVEQIDKMVSDENVAAMSNTLKATQSITADLSDITRHSKDSIRQTVGNLNHSSEELDSLMSDLKKTSRHINGLAQGLDEDPSRLIFPSPQKGVPAP